MIGPSSHVPFSLQFNAALHESAAYCLEVAPKFEDPGCKAALFSMAQTWRALADRVERAGDATHGIRHPQSVTEGVTPHG